MRFQRLFLNKYVDRFVFHHLPPSLLATYKLFRHGAYDSERVTMMHRAALWLPVNGVSGSICEFGCASGESFLNLYFQFSKLINPPPHFYLFDSFEGLPAMDSKTTHADWKKGAYCFSQKEFLERMDFLKVPRKAYTLTKGFFEQSLTPETRSALGIGPLALVHIDCDLYDSTFVALRFIESQLQSGTLLLFDDFYCSKGSPELGESGAFKQWLSENRTWKAVPWYDYSVHGKAFIVLKQTA
jgi:hypothetical protein